VDLIEAAGTVLAFVLDAKVPVSALSKTRETSINGQLMLTNWNYNLHLK
jgi:hypothetical protein